MIAQLRGILLEKQPPYLLLDVMGIGYEISAPLSTFHHLPDLSQETTLYTHLVIREDAHTLYGFHSKLDRQLFRALIKVNGVGPKSALTILSAMAPHDFRQCILAQNVGQLVNIPGIGKKTAERLMIEMKDTLMRWQESDSSEKNNAAFNQPIQEAISALIALGYKPTEAKRAIHTIQQPNLTSEMLIRLALKQMTVGV